MCISPGYYQVIAIEGNKIVLGRIGAENANMVILRHNNPSELTSRQSVGNIITPGHIIAPFPDAMYGKGDAPHGHGEEIAKK